MKCPYCTSPTPLDNSNLTHKLYDQRGCRQYFKVCTNCNTIIVNERNYNPETPKNLNKGFSVLKVKNILSIDTCPNCNIQWLPDFPLSWLRSITNVDKLYELLTDINKNEDYGVANGDLLNLQKSHFAVTFNKDRADSVGYEKYVSGALVRRMSEYISQLRLMGLICKNDNDKFILTTTGHDLVTSLNTDKNDKLIALTVLGYINIKLTNGFQPKTIVSNYQYFNIRFIENILSCIDFVESEYCKAASKYQIGLSVLCRNKSDFIKYCLENIKRKAPTNIKEYMFSGEKELDRAVVSGFLNVFISLNLIDKTNDLYKLTDYGKSVLKFLAERPAIWYDELLIYDKRSANEIFADIIIWRMIKNGIISVSDTNINYSNVEQTISKIVHTVEFKDIQLNLNYDEPVLKGLFSTILGIIHSKVPSYSLDDIEHKCLYLNSIWSNELIDLTNKHINSSYIANFTTKSTLKTGEEWEIKSMDYLQKLGFNTRFYRENPIYSSVNISSINIFLPGGTLHNPDLLIEDDLSPLADTILVDSKAASSITGELHKLMGYNIYASHPEVNSFVIIPLNGVLSSTTKINILKNIEAFDRICIIERSALELLITKNLYKSDIVNILIPSNGFKHITANDIAKL